MAEIGKLKPPASGMGRCGDSGDLNEEAINQRILGYSDLNKPIPSRVYWRYDNPAVEIIHLK